MSSFEVAGKIVEIYDTQQVSDTFKKREFVIETTENSNGREFTEYIKFQMVQERALQLDNYAPGDAVKVSFNIRGRRYEKNGAVGYFSNLEAWRIAREEGDADSSRERYRESNTAEESSPSTPPSGDDDLPF